MALKKKALLSLKKIDRLIEPMLRTARIPGAALAIVIGDKTVYAKGFGYRDVKAKKPMTVDTLYPIASTTKAMNGTLLGMLVEEGRLEWDAPVQRYLPQFRLKDVASTPRVTVRDLTTMRAGLPRHDWMWVGNSTTTRAELVERLAHLEATADFRQRFQYSNLTFTTAGHIAEVITGKSWEALVQERIFRPLGMRQTTCERPTNGNVTLSYHEDVRRELRVSRHLAARLIAPSGGCVHSTVTDMARWVAFNLESGTAHRRRLISERALAQLHAPQVVVGDRSLTEIPADAAYALGWVIHHYNGHKRVWHGGYLHDINSSVMCFPDAGVGMVSFTNFGPPLLADLINQYAFDALMGLEPAQTLEDKLALYQNKVADNRRRMVAFERIVNTRPSHPLNAYAGKYEHAGYGRISIQQRRGRLILRRNDVTLSLRHWHYDTWVAETNDLWSIHTAHPFDSASPLQFDGGPRGNIGSLSVRFEPELPPIRFEKL